MNSEDANMSLCLVTGGAGFIGSHIVRRLLELGQDVRVLDNFSTGHRKNLTEVAGRIDLIEGDICDMPTAQRAGSPKPIPSALWCANTKYQGMLY